MFVDSPPSGFDLKQRFDLLARHACNGDAFRAAMFAAQNSNSRLGPFQKRGEEFAQSFVGAIFDGWSAEANLHGAFDYTGDLIAAGAGLDANRERDAACLTIFQNF
jgi:hypothetical protein